MRFTVSARVFAFFCIIVLPGALARSEEKFVQLEPMEARNEIAVSPSGDRITLIGNDYLMFNDRGEQQKTVGIFHWGSSVIRLFYLPDGRAIACTQGMGPHVDMLRPDGSTLRTIISSGLDDQSLHGDKDWGSPHDMAVDIKAQIIFVAEETHPDNSGGGKTPDPQWARIGKWDFDGKYLGDVYRYDAKAPDAAQHDDKRIELHEIAIDPDRQRLYVTFHGQDRNKGAGMMAFDYSGKLLHQVQPIPWAAENGDIGVLKNGNVVCSYQWGQNVYIYSPELHPLPPVQFPSQFIRADGRGPGVRQFAVDEKGQLYASMLSPDILFMRWSPDMSSVRAFTIKHLWVNADIPQYAEAGKPLVIPAGVTGDPAPTGKDWVVLARPTDGSTLKWQHLPATYDGTRLTASVPDGFSGFYETAVRYGKGEIVESNRDNDPFVEQNVLFTPRGSVQSVAAITDDGRRAFRQGESIPLQIICRSATPKPATVTLRLLDAQANEVSSAMVAVSGSAAAAVEIPKSFTARLIPGKYTLSPQADGYASYPLVVDIAAGYSDSPMQRILYHEYGYSGIGGAAGYPDVAESMNYLREYLDAVHDWGFTRETDRLALANSGGKLTAWRHDDTGTDLSNPALAPVEYYDIIRQNAGEEKDFYLDRAVADGIVHDSHIASHCESLRFRDIWLNARDTDLQQFVQWAGRYPSHYGMNYHDEGFWGIWDGSWRQEDQDWMNEAQARLGSQNAAWRLALRTIYDSYNAAVHAANPASKVTCTPMWQGGLNSGTYPPSNFQDMSESYTHYLTEGTDQPWYVLHSIESFRRPGLPIMGVVENAHQGLGGEIAMKNEMLSLCRGVQGVGISFTAPLDGPGADEDALGADVYRTVNRLAKWYGTIYAQATPVNEAAVLFSTTQAGSEGGQMMGSPHWDAAYGILGGLMMAGVQSNLVYEEDVSAGCLLKMGKPRYPMLFLVDQTMPFPDSVDQAVRNYVAAGGRVFEDSDSDYGVGRSEVTIKDPAAFLQTLKKNASAQPFSRLVNLMNQAGGNMGDSFNKWPSASDQPSARLLSQVPDYLAMLLVKNDLYSPQDFASAPLSPATQALVAKGFTNRRPGQQSDLNASLLVDLFPGNVQLKPRLTKPPIPGMAKLAFSAFIPSAEGFANDSCFVDLAPQFEALAANLKQTVAQYRSFPLDTDDPWIERGLFDGGDIRYITLAAETRRFPWYAGLSYSFDLSYTRTVQPRTVELTYPATDGVVYDVFNHTLVQPQRQGDKAQVAVNLRQFSGAMFALAPQPLAAPAVTVETIGGQLRLTVGAMGQSGQALAAQVPIRIRVYNPTTVALEQYRGTSREGTYSDTLAVPPGSWTVEVTELLGSHSASGTVTVSAPLTRLTAARPDVETFRRAQLAELLDAAKVNGMSLFLGDKGVLSAEQIAALSAALHSHGIALTIADALPDDAPPKIYLTAGYPGLHSMGALLESARDKGLAPLLISPDVPGPGRGFIAPIYAPRKYGENAIALVGGDAAGVDKVVTAFAAQLGGASQPSPQPTIPPTPTAPMVTCQPTPTAPTTPRLTDLVGPRLNRIATCQSSPYLAVSATGFGKNLALIKDLGNSAQVVCAQRIGASPKNDSLYLSPDGRYVGLSARELTQFGEAFHLVDAGTQKQTLFPAFGDMATRYHHYAASADGNTVLAVGTYGVVCFGRTGNGWKEAWSNDYWKSFDQLPWPMDNQTDHRIPAFHAYIPEGADFGVVVCNETSDNGWVTPDHHYKSSVFAYGLADGRQRWRFDVPIPDAELFASLLVSPDARHLLVKVQNGSWNALSWSFYSLDAATGAVQGSPWTIKDLPYNSQAITVGNADGPIAILGGNRTLEVRANDGSVLFSQLWSGADPVGLAFSSDGKSLYVADDADRLSLVSLDGVVRWQVSLGAVSQLAVSGSRVYAAGWDGRVRAFDADGALCWTLDCTKEMDSTDPIGDIVAAAAAPQTLVEAQGTSSASHDIPPGEDLVAAGAAHVGAARVDGKYAELLSAGKLAGADLPATDVAGIMQDMQMGNQVQLGIDFPVPTDVGTLTVYENTGHPEAYPTDSLIEVWDETAGAWKTVKHGVFLTGPINTYTLNLKGVKRLAYCPWNSYSNNIYTAKLEVRLPNAKDGYEQNFDRLALGPINGQDQWQGDKSDTVIANPEGGRMLHVLKSCNRSSVFTTNPEFLKQVATFDFKLNRTINDPAFATKDKIVSYGCASFGFYGPDPNQDFGFGYEGDRGAQGAWINALRLGNNFGPHTIVPNLWYHVKLTLDRQSGSYDMVVTEKSTGKLYWHPDPQPCGKANADERGRNRVEISCPNENSDKGGVLVDNLKIAVFK